MKYVSIRLRLLLSYIAMIIIPIFFTLIVAILVVLLFRGDIKEMQDLYMPPEENVAISQKEQLIIDYYRQTKVEPERFLDQSFLHETNKKLSQFGYRLVVRKENKLIYVPSSLKNLNSGDLQPFGTNRGVDPVERIADNQFVSIKQLDFFFSDYSEGTLFFIQDASGFAKVVRSFFPIIVILLIVILVVTNSLLTYFVSRSIIRPIRKLQKAASMMKEGILLGRAEGLYEAPGPDQHVSLLLEDAKGYEFPAEADAGGTRIFNARVTNLAPNLGGLREAGVATFLVEQAAMDARERAAFASGGLEALAPLASRERSTTWGPFAGAGLSDASPAPWSAAPVGARYFHGGWALPGAGSRAGSRLAPPAGLVHRTRAKGSEPRPTTRSSTTS